MKCPSCGLINASSAERCDCGRSFIDGSVVPTHQPAIQSGERLKRAGCATGVAAVSAMIVLRAMSSGRTSPTSLLFGVLGDVATLIAAIAFIAWVIGSLRARRGA